MMDHYFPLVHIAIALHLYLTWTRDPHTGRLKKWAHLFATVAATITAMWTQGPPYGLIMAYAYAAFRIWGAIAAATGIPRTHLYVYLCYLLPTSCHNRIMPKGLWAGTLVGVGTYLYAYPAPGKDLPPLEVTPESAKAAIALTMVTTFIWGTFLLSQALFAGGRDRYKELKVRRDRRLSLQRKYTLAKLRLYRGRTFRRKPLKGYFPLDPETPPAQTASDKELIELATALIKLASATTALTQIAPSIWGTLNHISSFDTCQGTAILTLACAVVYTAGHMWSTTGAEMAKRSICHIYRKVTEGSPPRWVGWTLSIATPGFLLPAVMYILGHISPFSWTKGGPDPLQRPRSRTDAKYQKEQERYARCRKYKKGFHPQTFSRICMDWAWDWGLWIVGLTLIKRTLLTAHDQTQSCIDRTLRSSWNPLAPHVDDLEGQTHSGDTHHG